MKKQDAAFLFALGIAIWAAGTYYYAARGARFLETSGARFWVNFFLPPAVSAAMCIALLNWRHIAPAHWAAATLLLAIPGMVGEAIVLSHLATFMPRLHVTSAGIYGAFLFATYTLVLAVAEVVTLRATA